MRNLHPLRSALLSALIIAGSLAGAIAVSAAAGQYLKTRTSDGGTTFYVGRCFRMDIRAQTDNLNANSVDVVIPYNSSYLAPYTNSGCTLAATSVVTDGAFSSYPLNTIASNRIQLIGYDPSGSSPLNTGAAPADNVIAHVYWKVLSTSGSYTIPFVFVPGRTTDTNMAEQDGNGTDVLDGVETVTVNLAADTTKPAFSSLSPASGATGVSVTSDLAYVLTDSGAGVNTGALSVTANNAAYTVTTSGCTFTNTNRIPSCDAAVALPVLSYNTLYRITATGGDLAYPTTNTGSRFWTFTTEDDDDAPYVENRNPASGDTNVSADSNIVFRIKDYKNNAGAVPGLGVDIATVQVQVTAGSTTTTYQDGDAGFSYTGSAENYLVTINPSSPLPAGTTVQVQIDASDLHSPGNAMTTETYSFTIAAAAQTTTTSGTTGVQEGGGGAVRTIKREVPLLPSSQLPTIVRRRIIPQFARPVEEPLTPDEAKRIEKCYVDEEVHGAAPKTPYIDIEAGIWYEDAVAALIARGALDTTQSLFRGADSTLRSELAKLLVALRGITSEAPAVPSFEDVPADAWFYPYMEEAAKQSLMLGDRNCFGSHPCNAMPLRTTTRAEAAAMIVRYKNLEANGAAPAFIDVQSDAWYTHELAIAADHCIVQGDAVTGLASPGRDVTRAEIAVMLWRAENNLLYGVDCGIPTVSATIEGNPFAASLLSAVNTVTDQHPLSDTIQVSGLAASLLGYARAGLGGIALLGILMVTLALVYCGKIAAIQEEAREVRRRSDTNF